VPYTTKDLAVAQVTKRLSAAGFKQSVSVGGRLSGGFKASLGGLSSFLVRWSESDDAWVERGMLSTPPSEQADWLAAYAAVLADTYQVEDRGSCLGIAPKEEGSAAILKDGGRTATAARRALEGAGIAMLRPKAYTARHGVVVFARADGAADVVALGDHGADPAAVASALEGAGLAAEPFERADADHAWHITRSK
jgi:hypothetical protein